MQLYFLRHHSIKTVHNLIFSCEGSITNIFIKRNGKWTTPPIESGILDGTRKHFIKRTCAEEKIIHLDDLASADEILFTNSLRKEIRVKQISDYNGKTVFSSVKQLLDKTLLS